ncbi:MAG: hypothetical protein ACSLEN_04440 [Candidatus Malihini olakiniferum]
MVFLESPESITMEVHDVLAIVSAVRRVFCLKRSSSLSISLCSFAPSISSATLMPCWAQLSLTYAAGINYANTHI